MQAVLDTLAPLPAALYSCRHDHDRRSWVGEYEIQEDALWQFNELAAELDAHRAPLRRDPLATAARQLRARAQDLGTRVLDCIAVRMRRAAVIRALLDDGDWTTADGAADVARRVDAYVRAGDAGLLPDSVPVVGRLDDAILLDLAWPRLVDEVGCYVDFCRVREIERSLGNTDPIDRPQWERARRAEHALWSHVRHVGGHSYLQALATNGFHVH